MNSHRNINALILDMDGVLWRAEEPIGDLPAVFQKIRQQEMKVVMATNNSTRTVDQYLEKLAGFGVVVDRWQVITSSEAVAYDLKKQFPKGGPVYMIGEAGLKAALEEKGFYHSVIDAQAVVVGMDRGVTYEKLSQATLLLRAGVPFIGTNPDRTFPTPYGLVPGTGAIIAALEAASDITPYIVGKPAAGMYQVALERLGVQANRTLVIGDRLETDIAGAQTLGCPTGLVLSGVTSPDRAAAWKPAPDWVAADLSALIQQISA